MLVTTSSSAFQKRDLHVGGLGSSATPAPATIVDPMIEVAGSWFYRGKMAARSADEYVRANPWTALILVGLAGLAAGILMSQRAQI
jgi:DUF883 C-terminal glycine zipper region